MNLSLNINMLGVSYVVLGYVMRRQKFNHDQLSRLCKFTDPIIHFPEKEQEILKYYEKGNLKEPYLLENKGEYLIYNGNHRILIAINHKLTIYCKVIESYDDILQAQIDDPVDLSKIGTITYEKVVNNLIKSASEWSSQNPSDYDFRDWWT